MDIVNDKLAKLKERFERGLLTKESYASGPATNQEIQNLQAQLAAQQEEFLKSEYAFELIVKPNRKSSFMWVANPSTATLADLTTAIFAKYLALEQLNVVFDFVTEDDDAYSPRNDATFQGMLRQLVAADKRKITVSLETPSKPFSDWELKDVCQLFAITEDTEPGLDSFPDFKCNLANINSETEQMALSNLMVELKQRLRFLSLATRSIYVFSYLIAAVSLFEDNFKIRPEKFIEGINGRGPVDFAIDAHDGQTVGVMEVKREDFEKGVAQNAVQLESTLASRRKRKASELNTVSRCFGIVTDAEKWFFLECTLNGETPAFKLSQQPVVVDYTDTSMKEKAGKVLSHIIWLLSQTQNKTSALGGPSKKAKK
ncbi:7617_t:CDS:2 [Paraglomus brasilianum]|uniref:7617_t:CDS:1 n=1 Tax=Paraglomus brasilianum TaxID=144538 RepID=A0A9N9E045_9GLOM|nr:7617_t:CDS:2 [Paraglomus brasilianum]